MVLASTILVTLGCAPGTQFDAPARSQPTSSTRPPSAVSLPDPFVQVAAGVDFTCAVRASGRLDCFGSNQYGQTSPPAGRFSRISTAGDTRGACGLLTSGQVVCWGDWSPQPLPTGRFSGVCFQDDDGCLIRAGDRHVVCWGNRWADPPVDFVAASLSCNVVTRCALNGAGRLLCWRTWLEPSEQRHEAFAAVAAGVQYACGIRSQDRSLLCWGNQGAAPDTTALAGARYRALSADDFLLCAVTEGSKLQCLATPALAISYTMKASEILPPAELAQTPVKDVSCGLDHSCAVLVSGGIACWGNNAFGAAPRHMGP